MDHTLVAGDGDQVAGKAGVHLAELLPAESIALSFDLAVRSVGLIRVGLAAAWTQWSVPLPAGVPALQNFIENWSVKAFCMASSANWPR